jgi:ubiquinone biosynthesis protein COQ4
MGIFDGVRATVSFVRLANDLDRLNEVFKYAETLRDPKVYEEGVAYHMTLPGGPEVLEQKPRIGKVDLDALLAHPPGTLGHEFAKHMKQANLDPAAIPTLEADEPGEYIFAHYYETHDVWHVVTGFGTDKAGELGLQAFYLGQGGPARLSAMILSAGFLELLLKKDEWGDTQARLFEIARGYVMGKHARPLFGVRWSELWGVPLAQLRQRFNIDITAATTAVS